MQRRFARLTRRPWLRYAYAGVLLATLALAGCGGNTATATATPVTATCVAPLSAPLFWAPDIITVGLVSNGPAISGGDLSDVLARIKSLLPPGLSVSAYNPGDEIPALVPLPETKRAVAFFALHTGGNLSNMDCLGQAINLINASDLSKSVNSHVFIAGASPDWLTIGAGGGNGVGGSPDRPPTTTTEPQQTLALSSGEAGSDASVFVLDTDPLSGSPQVWPTPQFKQLPTSLPTQCSSGCTLLTDLRAKAQEADMKVWDECTYLINYTGYGSAAPTPSNCPPPKPNTFRAHGLFVSEIIHHLAPGATIDLMRVLNDYGAGDIRTLTAALQAIPKKADDQTPVVVNLSLSVEPSVTCLLSYWQKAYPSHNPTPLCNNSDPLATQYSNLGYKGFPEDIERLYVPFGLAVQDLTARSGYTVVAAAGNGQGSGNDATMPAAFCGVKDVAAAQAASPSATPTASPPATPTPTPPVSPLFSSGSAKLAPFSNLPFVSSGQCLSIQQTTVQGTNGNTQVVTQIGLQRLTHPDDALIAIGTNICSLDTDYASGIADWQGTSFAAAFISGNIAAHHGTVPSSLDQSMPCTP